MVLERMVWNLVRDAPGCVPQASPSFPPLFSIRLEEAPLPILHLFSEMHPEPAFLQSWVTGALIIDHSAGILSILGSPRGRLINNLVSVMDSPKIIA